MYKLVARAVERGGGNQVLPPGLALSLQTGQEYGGAASRPLLCKYSRGITLLMRTAGYGWKLINSVCSLEPDDRALVASLAELGTGRFLGEYDSGLFPASKVAAEYS
jgi:hypothetical protein